MQLCAASSINSVVLQVVSAHSNICKQLHMPAQSGSTRVLQQMRRGYSRAAYDSLITRVRSIMPKVSMPLLSGFLQPQHAVTLVSERGCKKTAFGCSALL
jgi:tRNA A37 methylthiotransferase MiaB